MSGRVVICECFARDGLQHEPAIVSTADKIALIDAFTAAGFPRIEATSYSHPVKVPAFGDADAVLTGITRRPGVWYKATTPNRIGVERAVADLAAGHGANEVSLLASATESHTERNLGTSREGQWRRIEEMVAVAGDRFRLVGVISVALGCPFEGEVPPERVVEDVLRFARYGVKIVTIGDTTGLGTPAKVRRLFRMLAEAVPDVIAVAHFHDTRGAGIANCMAAYEAGCCYFDSSFGGVGGHPTNIRYGSGRAGNVATEDLVNLFEMEVIATGLDLDRVMEASRLCESVLGRQLDSKVARAGFAAARHENA
ncbi:hydroxymethylglutaryl-CoA lyase [Mesorhizobium sp. 8]|uniref:hydroxymethylglutaryl-CoA lyase n=1 Tax=Mesorhizobium sp. 8 TaxID=2584466 RepID=UPI001122CCAF|nr:hydroxymethylglutaryl-CoA lyase [Mesorhizobium sp. 8]QDC00711.1 hydroxymethylglutaryl-CoA lyase [Mesorhizobium sp. 8]